MNFIIRQEDIDEEGLYYYFKDKLAWDMLSQIITGTITLPLLTEDGLPLLTEDGELLLAERKLS